jgi:hypothetical protein
VHGGRGPAGRGQWQSGNAQVIRAQAFCLLVAKDGNVGIDCPRSGALHEVFRGASPGSWQRDEAACGSKSEGRDLSGTAVRRRECRMVGIVRISYRYFEHVCDVCEHKCSDWTSKERDPDN